MDPDIGARTKGVVDSNRQRTVSNTRVYPNITIQLARASEVRRKLGVSGREKPATGLTHLPHFLRCVKRICFGLHFVSHATKLIESINLPRIMRFIINEKWIRRNKARISA